MSIRRGISVLDILPQTTNAAISAPDAIVERIGSLTVLDHRATTSADFFLHDGTLQAVADALDIDTSGWAVQIPGLTTGLPFRLAIRRGTPPVAGQEPAPQLWTLDIEVRDIAVQIPGVRAARPVGGTGATPLTLIATGSNDAQRRVFLVGQGVIRVTGGNGPAQVQLVDQPDPLDPAAPTGAVISLTARPTSFFFGGSRYGMTLDQLVLDLSQAFTPSDIAARGHDEAWEGIAFREATFYFPPDTPLVHSLSISTRDVILGSPGGLQGEVRIEFGQDFNDVFNTRIAIKQQEANGSETDISPGAPAAGVRALTVPVAAGPGGTARRLRAVFDVGAGAMINANAAVVGVWWRLPDGREGTSASTPWFDAPTDSLLRYRLRAGAPASAGNTATPASAVPADQTELQEVTVSFPRQAGSPSGAAPIVDATIGATVFPNVLHLRGPRARLAGIGFALRSGTADWRLGGGGAPPAATAAASFTLPMLAEGITTADLLVSDANGQRRIRIEVVPQGPLTVGHQSATAAAAPANVTVIGLGPATPAAVTDTFLALPFQRSAARQGATADATFAGPVITVPQGTDAEVEVLVPSGAADPLPVPPAQTATTSHVLQVLFEWAEATVRNVVYPRDDEPHPDDPAHEPMARPMAIAPDQRGSPDGSASPDAKLRAWLTALGAPNGRKFFVVGRTDDLKQGGTAADNLAYNNGLAQSRVDRAVALLTGAGIAASDITSRIETAGFPLAPPGTPPDRITFVGRLALPPTQQTTPTGANSPVWNRRWTADSNTDATAHAAAKNDNRRPGYRCAEIYVVDTGAAPPPPPPPGGTGVPVRILVPGPDGTPPPGLPSTTASGPPIDYRVRLRAKWDSPTVISLSDAIPTEAEALVAWRAAQVELPPNPDGHPPAIPAPTGPDHWEVLLHWTYDSRTGETEASGALSLPDGALNVRSDALAGALAFGPAITALASPSNVVQDPVGQFVAAAAILALGAAIGEAINAAGADHVESSVDIDRFAVSYRWDGASHAAATVDYTVDLHVNASIAGAGSLKGHLRLRYKGVGLKFDEGATGGLGGVALTYDGLSVEVVDPGTWSLGGPLGNLIRIAASRMGNGSQWMEFDLAFALDLGVIRLEGATIRLGLSPFSVEFRGLTASVDIPGTLRGRGAVSIGDGGAFRALLSLEVIPAKLSAYGSLAVDQDFVAVEVGVQLPVGLPLGGTGFGIFGFTGRFVANGTRNLDGLSNADPVQKQLDWYVRSPEQKYKRQSGQFAFGVGAVIGTLPDGAFTFNAEGSLTIGFPDVSVVFGIDAHLISPRKSPATEQGANNASTFRILGMVLIDETSIMLAVRASYEIKHVLKLEVPISAFFPLAGSGAWFIRIGTDNAASRPGSPVTITLLPDTLNVRAWAFVMIEEKELHGLGGTLVPLDLATPLDFDGFSIGMGAGFDLKWEAGPFKLEISAFLLVGMGTKPLLFAGAAGVRGELDLVVISVGVDGLVHFHISPGYNFIEGHFCGHVDCFFFEISGCVDIRIGDDPPSNTPEPEPPVIGMDLCDHRAAVKGKAARNGVGDVPVVWPDTTAVLKFTHYVSDELGASDFVRKVPTPAAQTPWSGTTELKYAYRITSLTLWKLTGADPNNPAAWTNVTGPFDAAWWLPTHRKAIIEGGGAPGPSTEEGRELGLFSWDPRAWSRWLGEGSQGLPGDPAGTIGTVCDPARPADPACAYGKDRQAAVPHLGRFRATVPPGTAFPSRFDAFADFGGGLTAALAAQLGADAGWLFLPGAVQPLHGAVTLHGTALDAGWRFPSWRAGGRFVGTAAQVLTPSKPLLDGELVLEICAARERETLPDPAICDSMPDKDGPVGGFTGKSGAQYKGAAMVAFAVGTERALLIRESSFTGTAPRAFDGVSVDVQPGKTVTLVAFGVNGQLGQPVVSSGQARQRLRVNAAGITRIALRQDGPVTLFEVCWGAGEQTAIQKLAGLSATALPVVTAIGLDGKRLVVAGKRIDTPPPVATNVPNICPKLSFPLPRGAGWARIEIGATAVGEVTLVALCGTTMEAAAAQAADQGVRGGLKGLLLGLIGLLGENKPTHPVYLDRETTYEIRLGWQYQGWRPANPGDDPPPPDPGQWKSPAKPENFRFRTAAFGLQTAPAPAAGQSLETDPAQGGPGYDERSFDPRGLTRYLTRAAPDHDDPPHFLDDHLGFWFMADHLEPLVEKYDRILQVKVLHTRPAAGSLHGQNLVHVPGSKHLLDVTQDVAWQVDTTAWFPADLRWQLAAAAAPCIGGTPPVGSSSVGVTADLAPRTEYDMLLNVAPKTVGGAAEVVVARTHFRTSAYRNPTGMLRALGFAAPSGLFPPVDAVVSGSLAAGPLQIGDTAFDAALASLGLDPWPLPAAPRTTVLWQAPAGPGQPWAIAGVLLEADEPVWRAGFRTGAEGEPDPPPRLEVQSLRVFRTFEKAQFVLFPTPHLVTTTLRTALGNLTERVRSGGGTRSLFVPAAPVAMTGGRLYDLELQMRENGVAGALGTAPLVDRPGPVAEEGE